MLCGEGRSYRYIVTAEFSLAEILTSVIKIRESTLLPLGSILSA